MVIATERHYPRRKLVLHSRFRVPDHPTAAYVLNVIAPYEAAMWGAPLGRLKCRIAGESGGWWTATNGQYAGVGQFAWTTFTRGRDSMGRRSVRLVERRWRAKSIRLVDTMSDGTTRRRYGWKVRQRVVHVYHGVIPRYPDHRHAWAQVRIMARAFQGLGAVRDSEWEVRC